MKPRLTEKITMYRPSKIHFIAVGSKVIQDLAIHLALEGNHVTCSDEDISGDSRFRLQQHLLLPDHNGWFPDRITKDTDLVIVGTRARTDNPEIKRAQELGKAINSFPEYIYSRSIDKQRVVVTGTQGRTMITSMIIHVLHFHKRKFDYVVGVRPPGLDGMVRLSDAPLIVIEGHDSPSSPLDPTPVFLKYHHHIGVISGIDWNHSDKSFSTEDEYIRQFELFEEATPKGGVLVFSELDPLVTALSNMERPDVLFVPYKTHASAHEEGHEYLVTGSKERLTVKITGKQNLQYISAAKETLKKVGITSEMFYQAMPTFQGIGD